MTLYQYVLVAICILTQILYATDKILSPAYGEQSETSNSLSYRFAGRIQSISWDLCQADNGEAAIGRFSFESIDSSKTHTIPTDCDLIAHCAAIQLAEDECINGHRVAYDDEHIHWIEFTTSSNNVYSCGTGPDYAVDSGLNIWKNPPYCLTGFGWKSDEIIKMIQFQYTAEQTESLNSQHTYALKQAIETTQAAESTENGLEDEDDEDVIIKVIPFMDGWLAWVIVATVIVICLVACVMARIFYTCCGDKKRELSYDEEVSSSELIDKKKQKKSFASTFDEYSSIRVSTKTKNHMLRVTNSCPNVNDTILGYVQYIYLI